MTPPVTATYRVQLRNGFGLAEAEAIVPYLQRLGISHLYLAPIFRARAGSTHGYDVTDPDVVDPAIGGEAGLASLCDSLRRHGMGLLLDIVPNHQGIGADNPYWWDLLKDGAASPSAAMFDVDWDASAGGVPGRLLLPVLSRPLAEVLAAGELAVDRTGEPCVRYFEHRFPLTPGTETEADLERLLARQHWRLAWWRCGNALLNWRRFFDITELAGVRVEEPAVFDATHRTILALVASGRVQGLRVDHIDGLADPTGYLRRLDAAWREHASGEPWILVEKILGQGEELPEAWPVAGTTGYEALNAILGIFVDRRGLAQLDATYRRFGGEPEAFGSFVRAAKREILEVNLAAETARLERQLLRDGLADVPPTALHDALVRLIQFFPYYRTYGSGGGFSAADRDRLAKARAAAVAHGASGEAMALLERALQPGTPALRAFEQLAGPAMAKALEDTAFYRWTRLVALNEVGGEPDHVGTAEELHRFLAARAGRWPLALTTTATHDTKRGEDTRLRIALLSHNARAWDAEVTRWDEAARAADPEGLVDGGTRYLLFQTLVGIWPADGGTEGIGDRLCRYMTKALREAKQRTSWLAPDARFETAVERCVRAMLADQTFTSRVAAFVAPLAPAAAALGLAQTVIKLTAPGVPDIYQGTERWDLSLVDPDNRRPVDFASLADLPGEMPADPLDWRRKQLAIARLLAHRRANPDLYHRGSYLPLTVSDDRLFAFARRHGVDFIVAIGATRFPARADASVTLPAELQGRRLRELLSGRELTAGATIEGADLAGGSSAWVWSSALG